MDDSTFQRFPVGFRRDAGPLAWQT